MYKMEGWVWFCYMKEEALCGQMMKERRGSEHKKGGEKEMIFLYKTGAFGVF